MVMYFASELSRMRFGDLFDGHTRLSEAVRPKPNFAISSFSRVSCERDFRPKTCHETPTFTNDLAKRIVAYHSNLFCDKLFAELLVGVYELRVVG